MKINYILLIFSITYVIVTSCSTSNDKADAYGNFEATEVLISAESTGKLVSFSVEEGDVLPQDVLVGYIDTIPLSIKREELMVAREMVVSKSRSILSQIDVLKAKLSTAQLQQQRLERMLKDNAATLQQKEAVGGEIEVYKKQIRGVEIQNAPVVNELKSVDVQLKLVEDQLSKCEIRNPIAGTVLTTYVEPYEITAYGKPLYKIADLKNMILRAYINETQLASFVIGQEVTVKIDSENQMKSFKGVIRWVASEAEFTPKIIQTKEERTALVYAIKVEVVNDGSIKIGMPAEVWMTGKE